MQKYIDDAYNQFVDVVAENRNLKKEDVLAIADGRIFTGKQAIDLGLVDAIGDYQDAIKLAARLAGIKGKPKLFRFPKKKYTIFDILFSDLNEIKNKFEATPVLKYQFKLGSF